MIVFKNITKKFSENLVVSNVSFQVKKGETLVLVGKSGSGKTTLLKMINRLIDPTSGVIEIDGKNILDRDIVELRHKIGYAIQDIGLFNHMSVTQNIGIVLKLLKWDKKKIEGRVNELLSLVCLSPEEFRNKWPENLSGGQKQRVGVARALAQDPPIILMDEPFGALDPITREQLQNEFLELESNICKTVLFVTHDIFEAIKMADRIAIINKGKIEQIGTSSEILSAPKTSFVEEFLGKHRFQLDLMAKDISKTILRKKRRAQLFSFSKKHIFRCLRLFFST